MPPSFRGRPPDAFLTFASRWLRTAVESKIDSIESNRKQKDQTLDNPLPVRDDPKEIEHVADHAENERASDRSPDRAPSAEQIHSAEDSGADARELIGIPDEGIAAARARRNE